MVRSPATWMISVPRRLKELNRSIAKTVAELTTESGQAPRPQQIAVRLGISLEAVYEGLQVGMPYRATSMDIPAAAQDEDRETLHTELPEREATIVRMRLFEELTQSQIAVADCLRAIGRLHLTAVWLSRTRPRWRAG